LQTNQRIETRAGDLSGSSLSGGAMYATSGTYDISMTLKAKNGYVVSRTKPMYISSAGAVTNALGGIFSTGDLIGTVGFGSLDSIGLERSLDAALLRFSPQSVGIWRESVKGIVADTVSRLAIIGMAADTITPVTITLEGEGSICAMNRITDQRKQLQLRGRLARGITEPTVGAYYTPPPTLRLPPGVSETTITVRIISGTLGTSSIPLRLVRPPVVLVHDAWSDPSAWERSGFSTYLRQMGYTTVNADYGTASVGEFISRSASPLLGFSAVSSAINRARTALRDQGIVVDRVDVVAHGLGGLIARGFLQSEERIFRNYAGSVRRFITLGTPHGGTPFGGLLWARRSMPVGMGLRTADVFAAMGFPIGEAHRTLSGADNDLSMQSLRAVDVNTHAITADWRPQATVAAQTMNALLRVLQTPNEYRAGVMFYDTLFGGGGSGQAHDLIVATASQRGGLSGAAVTELTGIAHSDLPFAGSSETFITSSAVMRRVNELLSSPSIGAFSPTLPAALTPTWNTRFAVPAASPPARGGIRITQPARGVVIPANSAAPIRLNVEQTGNQSQLRDMIFVVETIGIGGLATTGASPYSTTFTLPIPREISTGRVRVIVLAREVETGALVVDTTSITIQPQGKAQDMIVTPGALQLVAGTPQGIAQLETRSILTDNTEITITKAAQGTEYKSLTGSTLVSADGVITGIGMVGVPVSYDTILVRNGGIALRVPVRIAGAFTPTSVQDDARAQQRNPQAAQAETMLTLSPNPTSSEAVLSYTVPTRSTVRIDVVDMLGRHVLLALDAPREAGCYTMTIPTESLASGNYLVRVRTTTTTIPQQSTIRMTIIR
jgi:pimeloyl-ACP methyl ester carboxylesterase